MIPEKGKSYWIEFYPTRPGDGESYEGIAKCLGDGDIVDEGETQLYYFQLDDGGQANFADEDITEEVHQ